MMAFDPAGLMIAGVLVPLAAALLIGVCHRHPNWREAVTLVAAALLAGIVWSLVPQVLAGARPAVHFGAGLVFWGWGSYLG